MDIAKVRTWPNHTVVIPHINVTLGLPPKQNFSRMRARLLSDVSLYHVAHCVEFKLSRVSTEEFAIWRNIYITPTVGE